MECYGVLHSGVTLLITDQLLPSDHHWLHNTCLITIATLTLVTSLVPTCLMMATQYQKINISTSIFDKLSQASEWIRKYLSVLWKYLSFPHTTWLWNTSPFLCYAIKWEIAMLDISKYCCGMMTGCCCSVHVVTLVSQPWQWSPPPLLVLAPQHCNQTMQSCAQLHQRWLIS